MTFPCPRFASDNIYHGYDSFSNVGYWNKLFVHHCMFHHFDQNRIRCGKPKTNRAAISKRDQKRSSCQTTNGAINSPRVNKLLKPGQKRSPRKSKLWWTKFRYANKDLYRVRDDLAKATLAEFLLETDKSPRYKFAF